MPQCLHRWNITATEKSNGFRTLLIIPSLNKKVYRFYLYLLIFYDFWLFFIKKFDIYVYNK